MSSYYDLGREILKKILDAGYQAFFVGGFVRDLLLGIEAYDIDITSDATPEEIMALFPKAKATGLRYGTVTVFKGKNSFEITTYRTEGEYLNHRKPEKVAFTKELTHDLERRDFTINAFAMDYNGELTDLFDGKADLEQKLIRAIGDPSKRFYEDALRILRAFRFVSKLGFDIEIETFKAIEKDMPLLKQIAKERILTEFKKILENEYSNKALSLMRKAGIAKALPELSRGIELLDSLDNYQINYLSFFGLCFYLDEQEIPDSWRFSNKEKAIIEKVIELVSVMEEDQYNELLIYRLGKEIPLIANQVSKILDPGNDQAYLIKGIYDNLVIHKTCDLAFKGQDILELTTLNNAEIIGDVIDDITYQVITNQLPNDYETIKEYTMKLLENKYGKE